MHSSIVCLAVVPCDCLLVKMQLTKLVTFTVKSFRLYKMIKTNQMKSFLLMTSLTIIGTEWILGLEVWKSNIRSHPEFTWSHFSRNPAKT